MPARQDSPAHRLSQHVFESMDNELIIKKLLALEAHAEALAEECRRTRKMIMQDVSTPCLDSGGAKAVAKVIAKRNQFTKTKKLTAV
jgi:hypothetical protein